MRTYWGEWRYSSTRSLTSALDGGEWSGWLPGRFTPRVGWVGTRAVQDAVVKRNIPSPRRESNSTVFYLERCLAEQVELRCFQTTPIANFYNPHPLTPSLRTIVVLEPHVTVSFPSCNGILVAQTVMPRVGGGVEGGVLPINKDKDFTMQIGLLFPWQLLLSRAGVREGFKPICSQVSFLANINVQGM
jgi:hypothetical protein